MATANEANAPATPGDATATASGVPATAEPRQRKIGGKTRGTIVRNVGIPKTAGKVDGRSKEARAKRTTVKRTPRAAFTATSPTTVPFSNFTTPLLQTILKANGFQGNGNLVYTEGRKTFVVPLK